MSAENVALVQAVTGLEQDAALALLLSANNDVELAIARHFDGPGVQPAQVAPPVAPVVASPPPVDELDDVYLVEPNLVVVDEKTKRIVPLSGVKIAARVNQTVAEVALSLRFENPSGTNPIEAVFHLADEDIIVHGFEVCIGDTIVQGQCMEKQEAFAKYDDAISSGHQGFLAEKKSKRQSFDISAGNLAPGMACVVNVRYMTQLETVGDKFVFALPVTRTVPLPNAAIQSDDEVERNSHLRAQVPDGFNIAVVVQQPQRILDLKVDSHKCEIERFDLSGRVSLSQSVLSPARFELFIQVTDPNQPSCIVEPLPLGKKEESAPVVIGAQPQADKYEEPAFDFGPQPGSQHMYGIQEQGGAAQSTLKTYAAALTMIPKVQADVDVRTEMNFIIDCSGSMAGGRMRRARDALQLFLRALPETTKFNIVAFGDRHTKLFASSQAYTAATLERAGAWVSKLEGNMGGTNLLDPIADVMEQPIEPGWPRQIFLITDGDVKNKDVVLTYIREHIGDATRIFAFGIGSEVSVALMRGIARFGRGKAEFVESTTPLDAPVMRQVTRALQPVLSRFSIDWGTLTPSKRLLDHSFGPIFDGERFDFASFFEAPVDTITGTPLVQRHEIKIKAFAEETPFEFPCVIDLSSQNPDVSVQRLAAHAEIQDMEKSPNHKGFKARIIELALKYHLASKYTSFVAVHQSQDANATTGGHMVHMDVDEAIDDAKTEESLMDVVSDKFAAFGGMIRASGNYLSQKLDEMAEGEKGVSGAVGRRRDYDAYDGPVLSAGLAVGGDGGGGGNRGRTAPVDNRRSLSSYHLASSDSDGLVDDDEEAEDVHNNLDLLSAPAPAVNAQAIQASPRNLERSWSDKLSSIGSAMADKLDDLFGAQEQQQRMEPVSGKEKETKKGKDTARYRRASRDEPSAPAKMKKRVTKPSAEFAIDADDWSEDAQAAQSPQAPAKPAPAKLGASRASTTTASRSSAGEFFPVAPAPMSSLSAAGPPPPPPAAAPAMPAAQVVALFAPRAVAKASSAMEIIFRAQASGQFSLDATLAALLGKTLAELLDKIPAALDHFPDIWATALAITALELNFADSKDTWGLVHTKGRRFIAKAIEANQLGTNVEEVLAAAKLAL